MKLLNKLFILTATAIAISSCQGDLLDTKPYDKASSGSMWSNENFCTMGVASIYATLRRLCSKRGLSNGGIQRGSNLP